MNRFLLLVIMTLVTLLPQISPAQYFYDLSASADPDLFKELSEKAQDNIAALPAPLRRQYRKLLRNHPDILMNFLIAYESSGKLAQANPVDILDNYRSIVDLIQVRGFDYSLRFFLSYIAKQTVTDERITAYRRAMLKDGLQEVLDTAEDEVDLFRAVSLWCVERLKFQPTSGRDQSPLDIMQRSYLGRCEEMQILFIAACRTVGIPSRPASVSWWAHIDNNHAWAEVYLNGKWYYTGDMDTAYHPNQTWFSGLVDKTVMVFASGTLPDESDEVLSSDSYGSIINSTVHYSADRSRMLHLTLVDADQSPLPNATFAVMVYNWGQLRPLIQLRTDEGGRFSMRVGRGAFFISALYNADKDAEIKALHLIPSSDEAEMHVTIVLSDAPLSAQDALLAYPANEVDWKPTPPEWTESAQAAAAKWQHRVDAFMTKPLPTFVAFADTLYPVLFYKCRMNQEEFVAFSQAHYPLDSGFMEFMADFDDKFFWQADRYQWEAFYRFYLSVEDVLTDLPSREQYYLLSPTVHFEELPQPFRIKRRPSLYPASFQIKPADPLRVIQQVVRKLNKKHNIKPDKALDGLLSLETALKQKHLAQYQFKIMCISALRANGIPADYTRIPDVINVYVSGKWQYYDVVRNAFYHSATTEGSTRRITLHATDEYGEAVHLTDEQINMTMLRNGLFFPLNQRFEEVDEGTYSGEFDRQGLYLQIGYRSSDSLTGLQIIPIAADAPDPLELRVTLRHFPRRWDAPEDWLKPLLDELAESGVNIFLIGNYNTENCIRLAQRLDEADKTFLWIGHEPHDTKLMRYLVSPHWQDLIAGQPGLAYATLTLILDAEGKWQMYQGIWENLPEH